MGVSSIFSFATVLVFSSETSAPVSLGVSCGLCVALMFEIFLEAPPEERALLCAKSTFNSSPEFSLPAPVWVF